MNPAAPEGNWLHGFAANQNSHTRLADDFAPTQSGQLPCSVAGPVSILKKGLQLEEEVGTRERLVGAVDLDHEVRGAVAVYVACDI